jgi:hypothetical protein
MLLKTEPTIELGIGLCCKFLKVNLKPLQIIKLKPDPKFEKERKKKHQNQILQNFRNWN